MMKTILVLDEMPKRCEDCWLANFQREDCYCYCMALQKPVDYDDPNYKEMNTEGDDWRWSKCPLKELPSKMRTDGKGVISAFVEGYNTCLDAIEGTEADNGQTD